VVANHHVDGAGLLERSRHGGSVPHVGRVDADANDIVAARVVLDELARATAVEGKETDRVATAARATEDRCLLSTLNGPWAMLLGRNDVRRRWSAWAQRWCVRWQGTAGMERLPDAVVRVDCRGSGSR